MVSRRPALHGGRQTHGTVPDRGCGTVKKWWALYDHYRSWGVFGLDDAVRRHGGVSVVGGGRRRTKPCLMWRYWNRWPPAVLPSVPAALTPCGREALALEASREGQTKPATALGCPHT